MVWLRGKKRKENQATPDGFMAVLDSPKLVFGQVTPVHSETNGT